MENIKLYKNLENGNKFTLSKDEINNGRFLYKVMKQIKSNFYPFYNYEDHPITINENSYLINEQMNFHFYTRSDIIINFKNLIGVDEDIIIKINENEERNNSASIVCFSDSNTDNDGIYENIFQIVLNTKKAKKINRMLNKYESDKYKISSHTMDKNEVNFKVKFKQDYLSDKNNDFYDSLDELIYYILKDLRIKIDNSYMYFMDYLRWNLEFIAEEITDEEEIKKYLIKEKFK
ncbi:hypothetical protein CPT_MarsHill_118 [Staphylococcus phage MarsHill]|nr:hypothetical protein CPT_MarsHill_118 [Staphylococcus phage MarsHill]